MNRRFAAIIAGLMLVAGPALAQDGPDYLDSAKLYDAGLVKSWQMRLGVSGGQYVADVFRVDDVLYAATNDGWVYAIHAYTGAVRWLRQVTTGGYRILAPAHIGERVIFVTPAAVQQLDRFTGRALQEFSLEFPAGSAPVCDDHQVYIGGLNQRLYAFSPEYAFENWKAGVFAPITSRPQIMGDRLFMASEDGRVFALTALTRQLRRMGRVFGSVTADLVVREEGVYVASRDQSLYLLDLEYLEERWRARLSAPLFEPPVVIGDTAYQHNRVDGVAAVNTAVVDVHQRVRWTLPRGRQALTAVGADVLLLSSDGAVLVVRESTGSIRAEIAADGLNIAIPAPAENAVFLAGADGRLVCARPIGTPAVTAEQLRAALTRPALPDAAEVAEIPERPASITPPVNLAEMLVPPRGGPPLGGKSKISRSWKGAAGQPGGGESDRGADQP
ncbi:MAG TPA: PQQ-binding-like beta-propeller repeat protein [Phycisphaerae bacterium]|nr:PQQ-binding-like beta-propeller repeat protein [Phycisphaerae bacterium]